MDLHADYDGFVVFVQEKPDFMQLDQLRLGGAGRVAGFFRYGVLPANIGQL